MVKFFLKSKDLMKEFNEEKEKRDFIYSRSILNCEKIKIFDLLLMFGLNKDTFKKSILKLRNGTDNRQFK